MRGIVVDIYSQEILRFQDGPANVDLNELWIGESDWIGYPADGQIWEGNVPATFIARPSAPVPDEITMRQARLALLGVGLLSSVNAALDALPSPMKEAAHIEWEYASGVRRDSPLIAQLGPALGLTDEQVDALFTAGAAT